MKIGNSSNFKDTKCWYMCHQCKQQKEYVVMMEYADNVCLTCLRAAVQMLEQQQVQSEEQPKSTIVSFISETSDSVYYNPSTGTFCHRCAWCIDFITDDDPGKMEGKERVHQRECRTRYSVSFDLGV